MFWLIILILAGGPSIEVQSGIVVVEDSEGKREISIGKGTFLPGPADKSLAKKIVTKNARIKSLELKLDGAKERMKLMDRRFVETETAWKKSYKRCELENMALKGFWNRHGKTIFWSVVGVAVSAVGTYLLIKADVIPME